MMLACNLVLFVGVTSVRGAALRPVLVCTGVFALEVGVFARAVGVPALDARPFACGRFTVDGEFERVDEGVVESLGVLNFFTDRGSREAEVGVGLSDVAGFRGADLRGGWVVDCWDRDKGVSLCDREWPLWTVLGMGCWWS